MFPCCSQVLDAGSKQWTAPAVVGGVQPCGREDAAWVWDAKSFSLVLFGGFANRWLGDTWRADVSSVVGPGYACLGISPAIGPVAGGTEVTISGLRFRWARVWVAGAGAGSRPSSKLIACNESVSRRKEWQQSRRLAGAVVGSALLFASSW